MLWAEKGLSTPQLRGSGFKKSPNLLRLDSQGELRFSIPKLKFKTSCCLGLFLTPSIRAGSNTECKHLKHTCRQVVPRVYFKLLN